MLKWKEFNGESLGRRCVYVHKIYRNHFNFNDHSIRTFLILMTASKIFKSNLVTSDLSRTAPIPMYVCHQLSFITDDYTDDSRSSSVKYANMTYTCSRGSACVPRLRAAGPKQSRQRYSVEAAYRLPAESSNCSGADSRRRRDADMIFCRRRLPLFMRFSILPDK